MDDDILCNHVTLRVLDRWRRYVHEEYFSLIQIIQIRRQTSFKWPYTEGVFISAFREWECLLYLPVKLYTWWRHQMETFSALLAICTGNSPVSGEFPAQRPVTRSFNVFFDLRLNEWLSKHSSGWWLVRYHSHYDVTVMICVLYVVPCYSVRRYIRRE